MIATFYQVSEKDISLACAKHIPTYHCDYSCLFYCRTKTKVCSDKYSYLKSIIVLYYIRTSKPIRRNINPLKFSIYKCSLLLHNLNFGGFIIILYLFHFHVLFTDESERNN